MVGSTAVSVASLVYELINGEPGGYGPNYSFVVLDRMGRFEGGVVFTEFYKDYGRAEIHMAGVKKGWVTPQVVYAIMKTAVNLNLRMVVAKTEPQNKSIIRLMMAAGAVRHTIKDMRGEGKDEVLLTLKMQDMVQTELWRKTHGRQVTKGT
jgi:RimJ/RimL family protein N-acetyltransferase